MHISKVLFLTALVAFSFVLSLPSNLQNVLGIAAESRATGARVANSAVIVTNINDRDSTVVDYYKQYNGNGSIAAGWPPMTSWVPFMDMFNSSKFILQQSCTQFGFANDSPTEITSIYNGIQSVAASTHVDQRFILAVILQESGGCVRVPTTFGSVPNPGLMQDHNGDATCWNNSGGNVVVQDPCPASTITQMIQEGTGGTASGDGLAQCLTEAGTTDVSAFYKAARIYNSGSIAPSGDLGQGVATHCYASDIANRLTGWVRYPHNCTLDGAPPAE